MIRKLNPVLEKILSEGLVKPPKKELFDTEKDVLKRIGPESIEPSPKKSTWQVVPRSPTPVPTVTTSGDVVPMLPSDILAEPKSGESFSKTQLERVKSTAKPIGRFGAQMGLANLTPLGEFGEKGMEKLGVESPWGQYWGGWATAGIGTDLAYPYLTTTPRMIASGAKVAPAITTGAIEGLGALTSPLNLAITSGPLAVWGAMKGAEEVEEYIDTKDMTPQQKTAYFALKKENEIRERYNEWKKEKEEQEKRSKQDSFYTDIPPGR